MFSTKEDLIPVPCNPDALCMAYALKLDNGEETDVFPMTRYINPEDILNNLEVPLCMNTMKELRNI